jgi:hypothetical protein
LPTSQRKPWRLYSCSPPATDGERVGDLLGVFEVVERARLLEVHRPDLFESRLGRLVLASDCTYRSQVQTYDLQRVGR